MGTFSRDVLLGPTHSQARGLLANISGGFGKRQKGKEGWVIDISGCCEWARISGEACRSVDVANEHPEVTREAASCPARFALLLFVITSGLPVSENRASVPAGQSTSFR